MKTWHQGRELLLPKELYTEMKEKHHLAEFGQIAPYFRLYAPYFVEKPLIFGPIARFNAKSRSILRFFERVPYFFKGSPSCIFKASLKKAVNFLFSTIKLSLIYFLVNMIVYKQKNWMCTLKIK